MRRSRASILRSAILTARTPAPTGTRPLTSTWLAASSISGLTGARSCMQERSCFDRRTAPALQRRVDTGEVRKASVLSGAPLRRGGSIPSLLNALLLPRGTDRPHVALRRGNGGAV